VTHSCRFLRILTSHNIEWQAVLSLLEAVGSVEQRPDGKYLVHVGEETEVLTRPKDKESDVQQVVDLRRMLTTAGYRADSGGAGRQGQGGLTMLDEIELVPGQERCRAIGFRDTRSTLRMRFRPGASTHRRP